ncbi:response regulator transcription factor [Temperatibacter marinus]|uniref:Response regulator transcription factor n=1 Tax=Temperatibacter marinus TaxID=1456591 RepID=A0AA52EBP2_9PROT|nr:response regulator transcription factor [Temperatibacter marinus]WND01770.1 response regulator transcription factor [Temperatibacter marinus]
MTKLHILVVEDEENIALNIADYFEPKGHVLDFAINGEQGLEMALAHPYDVVLLDVMLPKMDGFTVCDTIRRKSTRQVPILMLTARDTADEKISGFHAGADDYLTKPFSLGELEVRCIALSRRHLLNIDHVLDLGDLKIDRSAQKIWREGKEITLKKIGYDIMDLLIAAHPKTVSRSEIIQKIWSDDPTESDALRSHIYQLRTALDKPFSTPIIKTVHGVGFALDISEKNKRKNS